MDCKNCQECDGPIGGLPCSHYWECYEADFNVQMRRIDDNTNICMMAIKNINNFLNETNYEEQKHLSFEDKFRASNPNFIDGQEDIQGVL